MAIFEFELAKVEDIVPWGKPGEQSLSWFALTEGRFRIAVGQQVHFRYTEEIINHWGGLGRDADYQIAAFARAILGSVAAAVAPLPPRIERLASNWALLTELMKPIDDEPESSDLWYSAWWWLGERSPNTSNLVSHPKLSVVRVRDEVHIHWDNRKSLIDGHPVWAAQHGMLVIPVANFLEESSAFMRRLLLAMEDRIAGIEKGTMKPQVEVSTNSLREQHEVWRAEFESYFVEYQPGVPWLEAENALLAIAGMRDMRI